METAIVVLAYLEVVIWPATVIASTLILRRQIASMAQRVASLKTGSLEAHFFEEVRSAITMTEKSNTADDRGPEERARNWRSNKKSPGSAFFLSERDQARDVAQRYRDEGQVSVNLSNLSRSDSVRMLDMLTGMALARGGKIRSDNASGGNISLK